MIPTEVFDCFAQGDHIPVMAQAVIENALAHGSWINSSRRPPTNSIRGEILFSSVVGLMSLIVCRIRPWVNAAYQKNAVPIPVSLKALYGKIEHIEPSVGAAMVRMTAKHWPR